LKTPGDYEVMIFSVILLAICILLPFLIYLFISRNYSKLEGDIDFKQKYGSLFAGIRLTQKSALMYNLLFMLRRMIFALSAIYLNDYPFF
jgi:hypothetical protein